MMLPASSTTAAVFRSSSSGRRNAKRIAVLRIRASSSEKETKKAQKKRKKSLLRFWDHRTRRSTPRAWRKRIEVVTDDPREQLKRYQEKYQYSIRHPGAFGQNFAYENYSWENRDEFFKRNEHNERENFDARKRDVNVEFFKGAKTNLAYNCLDRNIEKGLGDVLAIIFESGQGF